MKNRRITAIGGVAFASLLVASLATPAVAASTGSAPAGAAFGSAAATTTAAGAASAAGADGQVAPRSKDDRPDPAAEAQRDLNRDAVAQVVSGQAEPQQRSARSDTQSVQVKPGQWAQYGVESSDQILSFLVDFGDEVDPRYPDAAAGPVHNEIAQPDEANDNSTYWTNDFSRGHYLDMFFGQQGESLKGVYEEMSSGRYTVDGDVSDWVTVPYSSASYGETESQTDMTRFVQDTADAWYDDQIERGRPPSRSPSTCRPSTSGIATTTTATASSTSPTATSTTSRPSTPARARRPAPIRAPSGRTAGRSGRTPRARPVRPSTRSAASRSATPTSGCAITRPSPRTAAWASSPTSTVTTSVCPTSTTPAAARTAPVSGR
nr:hypothetical protein GCM10025699_42150 [Microbacterium flavescens]